MVCPHCGGIWTDAERARNSREGAAGRLQATAPVHRPRRLLHQRPDVERARRGAAEAGGEVPRGEAPRGLRRHHRPDRVHEQPARARVQVQVAGAEARGARGAQRGLRRAHRAVGRPAAHDGVDVQGDRIALLSWPGAAARSRGACTGARSTATSPTSRPGVDRARGASSSGRTARERRRALHRVDVDRQLATATRRTRCTRSAGSTATAACGDPRPETGEIFRVPQPIDPGRKTKAARYGLHVYNVGTEKAKDLLIGFGEHGGRLRLSEQRRTAHRHGPRARAHALVSRIRGDYFAQVTSEIKAPLKGRPRNKLYWQRKSACATRRSTARCTRCTPRAASRST
jgi:hypothetical protein